MATIGQIIFCSMVTLTVVFAALIILILSLAFSRSTPKVMTNNAKPVANLGEDHMLSCYISSEFQPNRLSEVSVIWEKRDQKSNQTLFYSYKDGALTLDGQASQFKVRAQVFPDALATGNASLLLRSIRSSDEGNYTCTIWSSVGQGKVSIQLRTAVFSAPTLKLSKNVLTSEANRWFPKPNVRWLNQTGTALNASTRFSNSSAEVYSVVSELQSPQVGETYICMIKNNLVVSVTEAAITETGVLGRTFFTFSVASTLLASFDLNLATSVLCMFYVVYFHTAVYSMF